MNKRYASRYFLFLLLALMAALSITSVASAQQPGGNRRITAPRPSLSDTNLAKIAANSVRSSDGRVQVMVKLADAPSVFEFTAAGGRQAGNAARTAANNRSAVIRQAQQAFMGQAAGLGRHRYAQPSS